MAASPGKRKQALPRKLSPIPFRVTEEERARISEAAGRVGLTVSAYIRTRVLDEAPKMRATRKASLEAETLARLLGQVGKVAGGLQQIVKKGGGKSGAPKLQEALADTRKAAASIMAAMGRKPHE